MQTRYLIHLAIISMDTQTEPRTCLPASHIVSMDEIFTDTVHQLWQIHDMSNYR